MYMYIQYTCKACSTCALTNLVNNVVSVVFSCQEEEFVKYLSSLFDESFKSCSVVLLPTQSRHLHPLHDEISTQNVVTLLRIPKTVEVYQHVPKNWFKPVL